MPRLIALEWDQREARIAVARTRGEDVIVEHAFAVDFGPRDAGQKLDDVKVGQKIASALAARNIGRGETLVAVGRASIELRQLTLPPSPFEELPDLVRFQALREFTTIGEDWPLDFVHLDAGDDESFSVLAAAISPEMVDQIQGTCSAAELSSKRLILRPFAAASLLRRHDESVQPCRLMVDLLADEADLTVLVDESVVLMRTVRLASSDESPAQSRALLGQIRRTIAAAQNQLRGQRVDKVILCGGGSDQSLLKETIESELSLDVELFDPFSKLQLEGDIKTVRPEHPGRFAPLLGMLVDEAAGARHAIDFLHPRRRPQPPDQKRRSMFIAATAAAACFAIAFLTWMELSDLDRQIADREFEIERLEKEVAEATKRQTHAAAVGTFLENDFAWLDELYNLSVDMPPPEDVLVTELQFGTRSPAGGRIIVNGYTRESELLSAVQESLRDGSRSLVSTGTRHAGRRGEYQWEFAETVHIQPGETPDLSDRRAEPTSERAVTAAGDSGQKERSAQ